MEASFKISLYRMNDWTPDIEIVLENIRINSVLLSKEHSKRYFALKQTLQYFRLPVIIISGINSIVSVGLQIFFGLSSQQMTLPLHLKFECNKK